MEDIVTEILQTLYYLTNFAYIQLSEVEEF